LFKVFTFHPVLELARMIAAIGTHLEKRDDHHLGFQHGFSRLMANG
jgi:hypothetical protein